MDRLETIFDMQARLQKKLGYDFETMPADQRMEYVRTMVLACEDELHEALNETDWKPWAKVTERKINREKYLGELADALHFFVNLCNVAGITADEIFLAYIAKHFVNNSRVDLGYDGTDKCAAPGCRRALDEPDMKVHTGDDGERYCSPEHLVQAEMN